MSMLCENEIHSSFLHIHKNKLVLKLFLFIRFEPEFKCFTELAMQHTLSFEFKSLFVIDISIHVYRYKYALK